MYNENFWVLNFMQSEGLPLDRDFADGLQKVDEAVIT